MSGVIDTNGLSEGDRSINLLLCGAHNFYLCLIQEI
jgi:hypothetical protein